MEPIHEVRQHTTPQSSRGGTERDRVSIPQVSKVTKDDMLYVGVLEEVRRARASWEAGRNNLALKHLREAVSLCNDYDGSSQLWQACRNLENELNRLHVVPAPTSPHKRRRASSAQHEPPPNSHKTSDAGTIDTLWQRLDAATKQPMLSDYRVSIANTADTLYEKLIADTKVPMPSDQTSIRRNSLRRTRSLSHAGDSIPNSFSASWNPYRMSTSTSAFTGISEFEARQRAGLHAQTERRQTARSETGRSISRDNEFEALKRWQGQLPQSPSHFKNCEDPSPRRHSFPVASPPSSPSSVWSSVSTHTRKRSIHSTPKHLKSSSLQIESSDKPDSSDSASDYSTRRSSLDETSTVLSDTPSLSKLSEHIHSNPFAESNSTITSRIRRLSTEISPLAPLTIPGSLSHESSEPIVRSPLREAITADDDFPVTFTASPISLDEGDHRNNRTPVPASSQTSLPPVTTTTSPTKSSPLRRTFSVAASEPAEVSDADQSSASGLSRDSNKSVEAIESGENDAYGDADTTSNPSAKMTDSMSPHESAPLVGMVWKATVPPAPGLDAPDALSLTQPGPALDTSLPASSAVLPTAEVPDKEPTAEAKRTRTTADSQVTTSVSSYRLSPAPLRPPHSKPQPSNSSMLKESLGSLDTRSTQPRHSGMSAAARGSGGSVSSLASRFENTTPTHKQPASSSPSTQIAFARAKAAFGGASSNQSPKSRVSASTVGSGGSSPSSPQSSSSAGSRASDGLNQGDSTALAEAWEDSCKPGPCQPSNEQKAHTTIGEVNTVE
ncbi:uncharacterized protein AB675_4294 [Cyphellophora attinorum]|uniref:Uncharacterized protein n=1 Tax=Cyphellophora attinorum TaxID=1664694 RepID=A0A0N1HMG8_9EURO|nr:uncharacterized protein AB675_4294 [Phialophora attinorum]KPI38472.1 hypothetical protein AB675_4294 [Phialophora attinorum]